MSGQNRRPSAGRLLNASRAEDTIPEDEDQAAAEDQEEEDGPAAEPEEPGDDGEDEDQAMDEEEEEEKEALSSLGTRSAVSGDLRRAMADGRRIERGRIRRILNSASAAKHPDVARALALDTGLASAAAIAVLDSTPAAAKGADDFRSHVRRQQPAALPSGGGEPSAETPGSRLMASAERRAAANKS